MPGFDQNQETLIALNQLRTALQGFSLVPDQIAAKQAQLLAETVGKKFKARSVFAGGLAYDFRNAYNLLPDGSNAYGFWNLWGAATVKILDLQDAETIRLTLQLIPIANISTPYVSLAYALSPTDSTSQIPPSQFSLFGDGVTYGGVGDSTQVSGIFYQSLQTTREEIPCAGNKYLHLFGTIPQIQGATPDFWTEFAENNIPGASFFQLSYALIK